MVREIGLIFTVSLINELNQKSYNLDNFSKDSQVLEKLLKVINMENIQENLDLVKLKCIQELPLNTVFQISNQDKKAILRYL